MTSSNIDGPVPADSPLDPELLDKLWDFGDAAGSEQRLRQALGVAVIGGTAHAELTTQLARSLGLQGRFDEAGEVLDSIDAASPGFQHVDTAPVVRIRLSLERGRLLNSAGDPAAAIEHFRDAWVRAQRAGDTDSSSGGRRR